MADAICGANFLMPAAATYLRFQRLIRMSGDMAMRAVPTMPASTLPLADLPIPQIPHHPQGNSYTPPNQDCFECFVKAFHHVDLVMPSMSTSVALPQCAVLGN
jgi:hypothetical protein